jgi:DNA-binding response OmpR family regulator
MHAVLLCHSRPLEAFAATALRGSGLTLTAYPHLPALLAAVRSTEPCAVLLQDDHEHLRDSLAALRMNTTQALPVIVIGNGDSASISLALQLGADDYAVIGEGGDSLAHRVRGRIASRRARPNPTSLRAGPCVLHAPTQSISLHDCEVSLTSREFALAWTLFENLGRVVSMRTLSNEIWGRPSDIGKRTIEQHVYKLRRKLGQGRPDSKVVPIQTVYGVGYRMHL